MTMTRRRTAVPTASRGQASTQESSCPLWILRASTRACAVRSSDTSISSIMNSWDGFSSLTVHVFFRHCVICSEHALSSMEPSVRALMKSIWRGGL